jgi:hypothetical protein
MRASRLRVRVVAPRKKHRVTFKGEGTVRGRLDVRTI